MTDTAISPLRRRMIEDVTIRQFKSTTQHNYVRFVKEFSIFFHVDDHQLEACWLLDWKICRMDAFQDLSTYRTGMRKSSTYLAE